MSEVQKIEMISVTNDTPDPNELSWAFPQVEHGMQPYGGRIIIQLRRVKKRKGMIYLVEETKQNEKWNNMIGKVIAIGPLAFKNRDTMTAWPEGSWANVGDFVRVPRWGGDRWEIKDPNDEQGEDPVLFMTINDHELIAKVTANPLSFKTFV